MRQNHRCARTGHALTLLAAATFCASMARAQVSGNNIAEAKPLINLAANEGAPLLGNCAADDPDNSTASASGSTNDLGPAGIVPYTKGLNASLISAGQYDSASGWASVLTPALAYRFDPHWTLTVNVPVFARMELSKTVGTVTRYRVRHFLLGDTQLSAGFEAHGLLDYELTGGLGLPTGDDADGLGAGQATYNWNNRLEKQFLDFVTPDLEFGLTNSNLMNDTRVRKSYVTVGTSAHFQAGLGFSLPRGINFSTEAYEDLPIGTQTVTSTTVAGKKGKQVKTVTKTSQVSIGEDNGFLNTLDVPLNRHVTVSGFYNHSLRNKSDTAGMSLTFLLRGRPVEQAVLR